MFCYNCGCSLSEYDFCTACGADVALYKKLIGASNAYYNDGLEKAGVRDLTGSINSLRQSLKFNKYNIEARNLLGLVYFEMGEVVSALSEWVISKNLKPEKNFANDYIDKVQSNAARLESINQTIKKYNQALVYCNQDSKDLAMIQLKKVLSLNPRFVRAHQLLALLYMEMEEWERAERELRKCMDIDRNNTQTLRYLQEVERMLAPDEAVRQTARHKKDEAVRYQSENELIIQPLNVKEPKSGGISTLVNIGIGLGIGLAAACFLVVPAVRTNVNNAAQKTITENSNVSDAKTVRIQELEKEIQDLARERDDLAQELQGVVGEDGTLQVIDNLLSAAATYLGTRDEAATAASLETILQTVNLEETSAGFQGLYQALLAAIGPNLSVSYFTEGNEAFRTENFTAAIESFSKAVYYDATNAEAWYYLARSYQRNEDYENAIASYDKVIELFPGTQRARQSQTERDRLDVGN